MIRMRQNLDEKEALDKISYLVGDAGLVRTLYNVPAREPFNEDLIEFLNSLSKLIMRHPQSRLHSDIVTFAFWIRKTSTFGLKEQYKKRDGNIHLGRGTVFHIAPSNVPVNFAYSLVTGLLAGNRNIVRVPSKEFPQVEIIVDSIKETLKQYEQFVPYIILVRYGRDKEINDALSSIADTRVVWGGDATIAELRKSELPPRSNEITFADRYSLAVIDADFYLSCEDKVKIAEDFYNDTYFSDQNACTSPRLVAWTGKEKTKAKKVFWDALYKIVKKKYTFQDIQGVNKLTSSYLTAAAMAGTSMEPCHDNLLMRVRVPKVTRQLMEWKDNSGFFFEYDCDDILDLKIVCDDKRCQTIGFLGDNRKLFPLIKSGIQGVDRVVPIGKTMDFQLIWDGYDLLSLLSRTIFYSGN